MKLKCLRAILPVLGLAAALFSVGVPSFGAPPDQTAQTTAQAAATPSTPAPASAPATPAPSAAVPSVPGVAANTITGKLDIVYNTRTQVEENGLPKAGVTDVYAVDVNASDTSIFAGKILHLPTIFSSVLGRESQAGQLTYDLNMSVRNPKNLAQSKVNGKVIGTVPITTAGIYEYNKGNMRSAVDAMGNAPGFVAEYKGQAAGKPPKNTSMLGKAKQAAKQAVTVTKRMASGGTAQIVVKDYDLMDFTDLIIGAGPTQKQPTTKVNGRMIYDTERTAWYFDKVTLSYTNSDGKECTDRLSGHIKWVESANRANDGKGQYEFDVRVNEPEQASSEAAAFQSASEADFFATNTAVPSLTGTMQYKDEIRGGTVTASAVTINLTGNSLSNAQIVALAKLVLFVEIVPMNAE